MRDIENYGARWGITFLRGASYLTVEEQDELIRDATLMYLKKEDDRRVETETYMGRITTRWKYGMLGTFGGIEFEAELETRGGKDKMSFLVNEQTPGMGYNFSLS